MNVNISNEFNFSDVHGALNNSGSLAKNLCILHGRVFIMKS